MYSLKCIVFPITMQPEAQFSLNVFNVYAQMGYSFIAPPVNNIITKILGS